MKREVYDRRCQERGYSDMQEATQATSHLSLRAAGDLLGIDSRTVSAERKRLGIERARSGEQYLRERAQLAAQAGFGSWEQALVATLHLSNADAALKLGISERKTYLDRIRFGLIFPRQRQPFDPQDPRDRLHGVAGYRRGCRCLKCRSGAAQRAEIYRQLNKERSSPTHGISGYTNYGCRCSTCVQSWMQYKRERKTRVIDGVVHGQGYEAGCRCLPCREAAGHGPRRTKTMTDHDDRHGTQSGYRAGCRCPMCRQANSSKQRERRKQKKALAAGS